MNDNHYQQNLYMKINLTITGCMGRMGQQLIKSSNKNKIFKIVSLTENFKINKKINNILPEFNNVNSFKKTNVIIDFTVPKCTLEVLKIAAKQKKRVVIGTTGFTKNRFKAKKKSCNRNYWFFKKTGEFNKKIFEKNSNTKGWEYELRD